MVDSVGRMPLGKTQITGGQRLKVLSKTRKKMEKWRDRARDKLLEQRQRLKRKVELNAALMEDRKMEREKNLNPTAFPTLPENRALFKRSLTHSTMPSRPKYSRVQPKQRVYGNKWLEPKRKDR